MRLTEPYSDLGVVDVSEIFKFISNLDEKKWKEWDLRQKKFNPHRLTNSFPIVWNSWDSVQKILNVELFNQDRFLLNLLNPILEFLSKKYEGTVVNCLFALLPSGANITPHKDASLNLLLVNRIHIPIKTNLGVIFYIEGKKYQFSQGHCFELSNDRFHSVENSSNQDRIHLIIDILPSYFNDFLNPVHKTFLRLQNLEV